MNAPHSLETVRSVLAQVQAANAELKAALRRTGRKAQLEGVVAALDRGAQLESFGRTPDGQMKTTVVHLALQKKAPALLSLVLAHGANPNQIDDTRKTPLMAAACTNAAWAIPILAQAGARQHDGGADQCTALELALIEGADDAVEALLSLPNGADEALSGTTVLILAKTYRSIRALVAAGADPLQHVRIRGGVKLSLLDWLIENSMDDVPEAVQAFIDVGVPPSVHTLRMAAQMNHPNTLAVLDAVGLDWNQHDGPGTSTPLQALMAVNPTLGAHWMGLLAARKQAAALEAAIGDMDDPQASPSRSPRM